MLRASEIWDIILRRTPRRHWVLLEEIYQLVQREDLLDKEDYEPQSPSSDIPKWKRNVRNVLQHRKRIGAIKWDGQGRYFLD
jgi:hypothetical protein